MRRIEPGRGYSSNTFGTHMLPNGISLLQRYYTPGPFDLLVYGPDCELATPHAEYSVFSGVVGVADNADEEYVMHLLLLDQPQIDRHALVGARFDVWSPDGEGELWVCFADHQLDEALACARSLKTPPENEFNKNQ